MSQREVHATRASARLATQPRRNNSLAALHRLRNSLRRAAATAHHGHLAAAPARLRRRGLRLVRARGRLNPLPGSQDHLPATYAVARGFVSEAEAAALHAFFASPSNPHIERTSLAGDELAAGQAPDPGEALVRQLYGNPQPFRDAFPDVWARLLALKDALGAACGVDADELARVSFAQDIRHITYGPGEECPWHRDDPISHFNTIVMLARPGDDFTGGELRLHPGPLPGRDADDAPGVRAPALRHGDAVIYSTPKVDHCVSATLSGTRTICLVELRREEAAERREGPR